MTQPIAVVVAKDRGPSTALQAIQDKLVEALERRSEFDVTVIPHLYDLAPDGPGVRFLRSIPGDIILLSWLYPRSAYWVLEAHGVRGRLGRTTSLHEGEIDPPHTPSGHNRASPERTLWCLDLRTYDATQPFLAEVAAIGEHILRKTGSAEAAGRTARGGSQQVEESTSDRWYPVIDLDRCDNCLECLNFCLFGVFGLGESSSIMIEQPDACRHGCPACARVCPQGAIMFPQHSDPAIAGDPDAPASGLKLDLSQLFAGPNPVDLAKREQQRALADQQALDNASRDRASRDRASRERASQSPPDAPPASSSAEDLVDRLDDMPL